MALNYYQWSNEKGTQKKVLEKYDVDTLDLITTKVAVLTQKVDKISINAIGIIFSNVSCDICGNVGRTTAEC